MKLIRTILAAVLATGLPLVAATPAGSQVVPPPNIITIGNDFFRVHVQHAAGQGAGVGSFTVTTGPEHPAGESRNVLFGDGYPGTSFFTIQSDGDLYTTSDLGPGTSLDPYLGEATFGPTFVLLPFDPPAELCSAASGDDICDVAITVGLGVAGNTLETSTVQIVARVREQAPGSGEHGLAVEDVEVNLLADFRIAEDDGPTLREAGGAARTGEHTFDDPAFDGFIVQDDDQNPSPPTFAVGGRLARDDVLGTLVPHELAFVCWPDAVQDLPGYEPTPGRDVTTQESDCDQAGGDSAVRYRWNLQVGAGGDPAGAASVGTTIVHVSAVVDPPVTTPTSITVTATPNPVATGALVSLSATVEPMPPTTGSPTGEVQFRDGAASLGAPVPVSGTGVATLETSALSPGAHSISAVYSGDDTFAASTSEMFVVEVVENQAPLAADQTVTATSGVATPITLTATDPEGDDLTFAVGSQVPQHGTLAGTPPNLTYTAASGYTGPDAFTFSVDDAFGNRDEGTVTITVISANRPPVATDTTVTVAEDTSAPVMLSATDPDGDPLTYTVTSGPSHGALTGTVPNVVYQPTPNYVGPDSFTFQVDDGRGGTDTGVVSIQVTEMPASATQLVAHRATRVLTLFGVRYEGLSATLVRLDTGAPVANQLIGFTTMGRALCTATTGADGVARCSSGPHPLLAILYPPTYRASFSGAGDDLLPTQAGGSLRTIISL